MAKLQPVDLRWFRLSSRFYLDFFKFWLNKTPDCSMAWVNMLFKCRQYSNKIIDSNLWAFWIFISPKIHLLERQKKIYFLIPSVVAHQGLWTMEAILKCCYHLFYMKKIQYKNHWTSFANAIIANESVKKTYNVLLMYY